MQLQYRPCFCVVRFNEGVVALQSIYGSYLCLRNGIGLRKEAVASTCVSFITGCSVHQWIDLEDELLYPGVYQASGLVVRCRRPFVHSTNTALQQLQHTTKSDT